MLVIAGISIGQDYQQEVPKYTYETRSSYRKTYSGNPYSNSDPFYDTQGSLISHEAGDEYLLKPGAFSRKNSQEKQLQTKVSNVTSGTLKALVIFGLLGICAVVFMLNSLR